MSDPRVEAAAKAIAEVWGHRGDHAWKYLNLVKKALFLEAAKAALAATDRVSADVVHVPIEGQVT